MTTRAEDKAYCLLGLLDVNMPMLYGEGMKAFHRLQLELSARRATKESLHGIHCQYLSEACW